MTDDILVFKEEYTPEERAICKLFCEKLFSPIPGGIGDRDLNAVEHITMLEVMDMIQDAPEVRAMVIEDVIVIYRTNEYDHIVERARNTLSHLYAVFVGLCRTRMEGAVGLPFVVNSVTGRIVDGPNMYDAVIEAHFDVVRQFEESIHTTVLYDEFENLTDDAKTVIFSHLEYCMRHKEAMYFQAYLYYDLQSTFVCDEENFVMDQRRFNWRMLMGSPKDECLDFRGVLYCLKFLDYRTVEKMKYFSKYNYEIFLYKRRTQPCFHGLKMPRMKDRVATLLWCSDHGKYLCDHSEGILDGIQKLGLCTPDEIRFYYNAIRNLGKELYDKLRLMSGTRSAAEVLAIIVLLYGDDIYRMGFWCSEFILKNVPYILFGMMAKQRRGSLFIKQRLGTQMFDGCPNFIDANIGMDARIMGYSELDREDDDTLVDTILDSRLRVDTIPPTVEEQVRRITNFFGKDSVMGVRVVDPEVMAVTHEFGDLDFVDGVADADIEVKGDEKPKRKKRRNRRRKNRKPVSSDK